MFRVAKNDVLRTFIDVPQINAPSIKVGDTADLTFVQHPGQVFHGKVTRTANSLDLNTRTVLTEVDIDNHDGLLLPGMYATVNFHVPRTVAAILIPSEALVFRSNGTTVAVVDDHHIVTFRQVVVGHDYGASIEIISGLKAGEAIVVNPNDTTFEGARVNPVVVKQPAGSLSPAATSAPASSNTQSNTQHK
jgi:RND family efflux transporter MFP subunit